MTTLPSLFVSHGAPTLAIEDNAAHRFLKELGARLPRPRAILSVSAHWEAGRPLVSTAPRPETIHDFGGFPRVLHEMTYGAPGAPDLAPRIVELLGTRGIEAAVDPARGLDHGTWVPLSLMWPGADIPVTQLSLVRGADAAFHLDMGRALAPLAAEGVLVLGSGSTTHGLADLSFDATEIAPWAAEFADWVARAVAENRVDDLVAWRSLAPSVQRNHPTNEHFLPLLAAVGAGGAPASVLHRSYTFGMLAMDAYAFGGDALALAA